MGRRKVVLIANCMQLPLNGILCKNPLYLYLISISRSRLRSVPRGTRVMFPNAAKESQSFVERRITSRPIRICVCQYDSPLTRTTEKNLSFSKETSRSVGLILMKLCIHIDQIT